MTVARRLIVNADDFGRSPGINRGIITAHREGIVTSTTLMVNLPSSEAAAALAQRTPSLSVGLHLSFCYGPPLSPDVPSLLGAGGRLERDLDVLRERLRSDEVEREARAQLGRFVALRGALPTHIDSHQHVHAWPEVREVVARVAADHDLPVRACDPTHRCLLRERGVRCPDHFVADFFGAERVTVDHLLGLLTLLPAGATELMCHPGFDDDALDDSAYRQERETELATLCSPKVREYLRREHVELVALR